ncbi:MAG TPA: hypothetical protein PKI62_07390 [bacterium]|nr:hypothetical protein [bacterium]HPR87183.1 hypothetical protein [bacterium]
MLHYAALNLGYREWGNKPAVLKELARESGLNFLCANVSYKDSSKTVFVPYVIREVEAKSGSHRLAYKKLTIALIGLTDNQLAQLFVNRPGEPELTYRDPVEVAREIMPVVRKKADLVVLLYYGKHEKMKSVLQNVPGIDVAVMGGENYLVASQSGANEPVPVVSTPSMGKYVGVLTLQLDKKKKVISSSSRQVPLKEDMVEDARFKDLVNEFDKESQKPKSSS